MPMSIHLKSGFAFIEVVISMAMLGVILTSLFVTTGSCMNRVFKTSLNLSMILPLKHSFYLVELDPSEKEKRTIPLPSYCSVGSIEYKQKKVAENSLFSRFTNLYLQESETFLEQDPRKRTVSVGLFVCIPPKQKDTE